MGPCRHLMTDSVHAAAAACYSGRVPRPSRSRGCAGSAPLRGDARWSGLTDPVKHPWNGKGPPRWNRSGPCDNSSLSYSKLTVTIDIFGTVISVPSTTSMVSTFGPVEG